MVAPNDKYRSIAPGQTINFEFTPNYPGVFMYHCGTPMVLEHIAAGMYGMMIVEPREGYPVAQRGKLDFESKCLACHSIAGGDKLGPGRLHRVSPTPAMQAWLVRWMKDPEGMAQSDPIGKEMLAKYKVPMPNQNVSEEESPKLYRVLQMGG